MISVAVLSMVAGKIITASAAGGVIHTYQKERRGRERAKREVMASMQEVAATQAIAAPEVTIQGKSEENEKIEWSDESRKTTVIVDSRIKTVRKGMLMQGATLFISAILFNEIGHIFSVAFAGHSEMFKGLFIDSLVGIGELILRIIQHW